MQPSEPAPPIPATETPPPDASSESIPQPVSQDQHFYNSDESTLAVIDNMPAINWEAPEFIAHAKNASWYLYLAVGALVLAGLIWLVTKDIISAGVVIFGASMFGVYAGRQPKHISYQLAAQGINIGERAYSYSDFKSFAIVPEETTESIIFMPLKRFAPLLTIYYGSDQAPQIVEFLAARLPLETYKHDLVDNFVRRIHF